MKNVTPKPKTRPRAGVMEDRELAELAAAVARVNFWYRRIQKRHGVRMKWNRLIPNYGVVKIVEPPEEFEEITGEDGVVLGGGKISGGSHAYTILVPSTSDTYYLPGSALQFTGVTVAEGDIYAGNSLRVVVDEKTGEGRVVQSSFGA